MMNASGTSISAGTSALAKTDMHPSFGRVVRSEWIKLRTLRSNRVTILGTVAIIIALGALAASSLSSEQSSQGAFQLIDPVTITLLGFNLAVLSIGVLGVMIGAGEYGSELIRTTLAAVPARIPVLVAKALVFVGVLAPLMILSAVAAFLIGSAILEGNGHSVAAWDDSGVARAVIGNALYVVAIGLLGLALGFLMRGLTGAIATLIGGVLILPNLLSGLLPQSWDAILKYLPSNAGRAFTTVSPLPNLLGSTAGAVVLMLWVVIALIAAGVTLVRRDA
jgi:ABC-2 type transport system permease protein